MGGVSSLFFLTFVYKEEALAKDVYARLPTRGEVSVQLLFFDPIKRFYIFSNFCNNSQNDTNKEKTMSTPLFIEVITLISAYLFGSIPSCPLIFPVTIQIG